MITPDDIRRKVQRWWDDQSFLRAWLAGEPYFPRSIGRIGQEDEADLLLNFARISAEQEALRTGSHDERGYGYNLHWEVKQKRSLGQIRLINQITFDTVDDWLRYIDQKTNFERFTALVALTRQQVPELEPWLRQYPLRLLNNGDDWPNWLAICQFFRDTYEPDRYYVRQLPLPVHTKFLEGRSMLLINLLSIVRPALLRPEYKDWRKRLGLLVPEPMIRTRALDDILRLDGKHNDFGLPLSAFARHIQPANQIVICENLLNFLTFPPISNAVAIWSGGGFTIECLSDVAWLREKQILYWGDLDAHGFQILNQCRKHFPQTQAILMDQATFEVHKYLVGKGETTPVTELPYLTDEEQSLFQLFNCNGWRIEQERLGEEWVRGTIGSKIFP
jgi:hypothetical protein